MFLSRRVSVHWRRVWIVAVLKHEAAVSQMFVMVLVLDSNLIVDFYFVSFDKISDLQLRTSTDVCASRLRSDDHTR